MKWFKDNYYYWKTNIETISAIAPYIGKIYIHHHLDAGYFVFECGTSTILTATTIEEAKEAVKDILFVKYQNAIEEIDQ
jgi:hypothetical protein